MLKLYTYPEENRSLKALIAARFVGAQLELPPFNYGVDNKTDEFLQNKNPFGKVPVLETSEGCLFESNSIARYVAGLPKSQIYGSNLFEKGLIDQWVDICPIEIDLPTAAWILPILGHIPNNAMATRKAKQDVRILLGVLNRYLLMRTYFVGECISLADICVACSLLPLYKLVLDPGFRREFVNVNRWFMTCINQPQFKEVLGDVQICTKMAVAPALPEEPKAAPAQKGKQQQAQPAAKKQTPKQKPKEKEAAEDEDAEDEAVERPKKKEPNELDLLPPSKFKLDDWKRCYSNEDTRKVAIPWFWENFDPEGFSVWLCDYKHEVEHAQVFMVSNFLGGFIQRLDELRNYGFGSLIIFGASKPFEISGAWVFRGLEIPKEMKTCPDFDLFEWRRADIKDGPQRELIEDYFSWDGKLGGRAFNQGKVFK